MMNPGKHRKRTIKAARKVAVEDIRAFLDQDDYILVWKSSLDCWFITNLRGDEVTIEDEAANLAVIEYMKNHGFLVFEET